MPDKKLTDNEIVKALERLKNSKDYLKEQYQEQVKKCPYPELKPIAKRTYEDNKKAFDIAIKAIEEFNRLQAENDNYSHNNRTMTKDILDLQKENEELRVTIKAFTDFGKLYSEIKAEAYKECIEKVKEKANKFKWREDSCEPFIIEYRIGEDNLENLLKELVGNSNVRS